MESKDIVVRHATASDTHYAERICKLIYESALNRGTGIARRTPEYVSSRMEEGKAVVALDGDKVVGFSYIETWSHGDYVATSGLIVDPDYRGMDIATRIKEQTFALARLRYPEAKIFSITTSLPVMKLNTRLGYKPVTLSELTQDPEYWKGCEGCVNYDILVRNNRRVCLCYGMLFDPKDPDNQSEGKKGSFFTPYVMNIKNKLKAIFNLKK